MRGIACTLFAWAGKGGIILAEVFCGGRTITSIAQKYPECAALCALANDSANRAQTLWFAFLGFGAFLIVAVIGTTHRDLFLETPISLPLLNLNLPLVGFYIFAPALFLLFHVFLLIKLTLLAYSYVNFETQVQADIEWDSDREQMRKHINSTLFLQAVRKRETDSWMWQGLFAAVLFCTLVLFPIIVFVTTQIRFLPYQCEAVTWAHRGYLVADLAAGIIVYEVSQRDVRMDTLPLPRLPAYAVTALLVIASWTLLTFPAERVMDNNVVAWALGLRQERGDLRTTSWNGLCGEWCATRLLLANEDFVDENEISLDLVDATVVLRGRSLVGAVLQDTDLREAVFDGGDLRFAILDDARLDQTSFDRDIGGTATNLQGASLVAAQLQGASLEFAQLQGALLIGAQLQGASLKLAQLQGALLDRAQLQGALLDRARLQGALLDRAQLHGASLYRARLQGASLRHAQLQGASLRHAQLQGASLYRARLQGASLRDAQLQGALLGGTDFSGATLVGSHLWRSHGNPVLATTRVSSIQMIPLSESALRSLRGFAVSGIRDDATRDRILGALDPLARDTSMPEHDLRNALFWFGWDVMAPTETDYQATLADILQAFACDFEHGPFVAQGLLRTPLFYIRSRIGDTGPHAIRIARLLLDAADGASSDCRGAASLDERSISELHRIIADAESEN
jgi:uncharacterized protein YjbI with pentapeptide repeats